MFTGSKVIGLTALAVLTWSSSLSAADMNTRASWQHREAKFVFQGFTTYYTCEGLEDKVREILLLVGARKDVKVRATGCPDGPHAPSAHAWVSVDYFALAPVAGADKADVDNARWGELNLTARRPFSMGEGECEIVDQMKPLIKEGFALNDVDYHTNCFPHHISLGDYMVKARVLRAAAASSVTH